MSKGKKDIPPASLVCERGLVSKIKKLRDLGFNASSLLWLVDLRNAYMHGSNVHLQYAVRCVNTDEQHSVILEP